jgi:DNA-binding NarL/FixJ family response regulator
MAAEITNGARPRAVAGSVLIVDDCAVYREVLASALVANGVRPIRMAWDLPSLIGVLEAGAPLVILMNMATIGVRAFLRAAARLSPRVPVVAVGTSEKDEGTLVACVESGVAAYHMRTDSLADLLVLIRVVAKGGISYPPQISAMLLRRVSAVADGARPARIPSLTTREIQVLRMLKLGLSNQEIAARLQIAIHTVKSHVHSLLTKLGVSSRAEAAALPLDLDLDPGPHHGSGPGSNQNWP